MLATSRSAPAGGMESMSNAPYILKEARFGYRVGHATTVDAMVNDGPADPFSGWQMFEEATEVGDRLEMTRHDRNRWALRSHQCAIKATDDGRLSEEIVPVTVVGRKGVSVVDAMRRPVGDSSLDGQPIGASGTAILGALVYELRRRGGGVGCAAICSGGGQGDAFVVEVYGDGVR